MLLFLTLNVNYIFYTKHSKRQIQFVQPMFNSFRFVLWNTQGRTSHLLGSAYFAFHVPRFTFRVSRAQNVIYVSTDFFLHLLQQVR